MVHRPGVPEDLLPAEQLWARWGALAVVSNSAGEEAQRFRHGLWALEGRLRYDDSGCTAWWFVRCGSGRYVLFGRDESEQVVGYEPEIDVLAGGPEWLPYEELRERIGACEIACVYWYEGGVWGRAPYPDDLYDDGLDCGMGGLLDRESTVQWIGDHGEVPVRVAERLLEGAERYRLTPELLEFAVREWHEEMGDEYEPVIELPAALRALELTGLDRGTP